MRSFLAVIVASSCLFAQSNAQRPHILGLAHVAVRVGDMGMTRAFYETILGYAEPFTLNDGKGRIEVAFVKVNDQQYVELFAGEARSRGQFDHFALYTDDIAAMRDYLVAQQVPILGDIHKGRIGNPFFTISDPVGHHIEIVQYSTSSLTARSIGKFMPSSRISSHIAHVGVLVSSMGPTLRFYEDVLGFREISRSDNGREQPDRVDLQTADGNDSIELLSLAGAPLPPKLRPQDHFCLETSDVRETVAMLQGRAVKGGLKAPIMMQTGDNLPPRATLSDPDGIRVEIMEAASAITPPSASVPSVTDEFANH